MEAIDLVIANIESTTSNILSLQGEVEKTAGDNCSIFGSMIGFANRFAKSELAGILKDVQAATVGVITKIKESVAKLKDVIASVKMLYSNIKKFLGGLTSELLLKVTTFFNTIKTKFDAIKNSITGIVNDIKSSFSNLKNMFADKLKKFNHAKCSLLKSVIPQLNPDSIVADLSSTALSALNTVKSEALNTVPKFDISIPTNLQDMLA